MALGAREIDPGKVLFFAGENPDDVRMRWIKLCEEMKIDANTVQVFWRAGSLKLSDRALERRIAREIKANGPFALIIIDTSAAFFEGDDENSNTQMGKHSAGAAEVRRSRRWPHGTRHMPPGEEPQP